MTHFKVGTRRWITAYHKSGRKNISDPTEPNLDPSRDITRGETQEEVSLAATDKTCNKRIPSRLSEDQRE